MKTIFSKINPTLQIVSLIRRDEITQYRHNLSEESECIQVAAKKVQKGTLFPAHRHNVCERKTFKTQEAWVVLQGKIKALFYDIDDVELLEVELSSGDCAVVFNGGHGFEVLEDDTIIYEFKNGPYFGKDIDKMMLDNT